MTTRRKHERLWNDAGSGLVVPAGIISDLSQSSAQTYLQVKDKATAIEQLYTDNSLPFPTTCDLARLVEDAKILSDSWLGNSIEGTSNTRLFRAGCLDRIADAILPLADAPNREKYLTALTSGSLDFLQRDKSVAKDMLWELELWSVLRKRSLNATLCEPPDIVVALEDARVGIACKKLYSEKHVQNVLSQGVSQIAGTFDFGIVAINLDDLIPPAQILRAPTQQAMGQCINDLNIAFLRKHQRHFRKYLASGRLLSAIVSTSILADVYAEGTRFNNARQMTIWAVPGLSPEKENQLSRFYMQLML